MNSSRVTLCVAVCIVAVIGFTAGPAMAAGTYQAEGGGSAIDCSYSLGSVYNKALIPYDGVSRDQLWENAKSYAKQSIDQCDLDGREVRELAGEIRAHVIGEDAPGPFDPGSKITLAGSGVDQQEDVYGFLMNPVWDKHYRIYADE
jgi:hypothetical protein